MFGLGTPELLVVVLLLVLFFGAKKIPELMRSLGQGISEFRKGLREVERQLNIEER